MNSASSAPDIIRYGARGTSSVVEDRESFRADNEVTKSRNNSIRSIVNAIV